MSYCGICGDDDHTEYACSLRLGNYRAPDQDGLLPQHRRCWTCKQITHAWDNQPCGQHTVPGAEMPVTPAPPPTPRRDRTHDLQALALAQAAEARAAHPDLDAWFRDALQREQQQIRVRADDQAPGEPASDQAGQHT